MIIVPNGTKRIMVAQTFGQTTPDPQIGSDTLGKTPTDGSNGPNGFGQPGELSLTSTEQTPQIPNGLFGQEKENSDDGSPDITDYIYKKLQSFGYPPRRLEQFENKFIDEKMYPGGLREVSITIPDRYYAKRRRLGDKDISKMVEEIGSEFGLSFVDAQRKDKSIIMNFTSQPEKDENGEEDAGMGDVLDEVYGSPSSSDLKSKKPNGKKSASKNASTINELIKDSQNSILKELLEIVKGKK